MMCPGKPRVEQIAQQLQGSGGELSTKQLRDLGCGRTVGRYTLLRRIATGGMAEVYVARSKGISGFEKKVAIKKILPQHAHNERFIDMIVDEAKITVSLTHPNIAQVYELGLEGKDAYFIVMELVDGRPLNKLMQRVDERGLMTIPVEHSAHVMSEVAKGLDHAHRQRDQRGNPLSIVHRDISPQNVLISYQGDVKLIDFGIARAEGRIAQTSHGVIKGKLRYLAPEIAMGEEPDHRADVFCCGIVLFEMLTGEAMFAPRSDLEAIEMASEARVRSPRSRNPKVPVDLDEIVMRALRRDRKDRYQTAKDLHSELRRFLNQAYPSFVGNELGDFMQNMFGAEIGEEKKLDALAETVAQQSIEEEESLEEPTYSGTGDDVAPSKRPYKQLVTRMGIDLQNPGDSGVERVNVFGADGGRAMGVVLDDSKLRPPIERGKSNIKFPVTMPPQHNELTMRAENPFNGPSIVPTVRGPAPTASDVSSVKVRSWDLDADDTYHKTPPPNVESELFGPDEDVPTTAKERTTSFRFDDVAPPKRTAEPPSWLPPQRDRVSSRRGSAAYTADQKGGAWGYIFAFVAVAVAGGSFIFAGLYEPPDRSTVVIPARNANVDPPQKEPITLDPVIVLAPDQKEPEPAGEEKRGTIIVKGAAPGEISADKGRVVGVTIVELPIDETVTVEIERAGKTAYVEEVDVNDAKPITVNVPSAPRSPAPVRTGILVVNSRPVSTVYVDGKKRGTTPLRIKLTAGKHKVTLKSPDGASKTSVKVIAPGKTNTVVHRW